MRRCLLLVLLAASTLPAFAAKRITVEQLDQILAAAHGKPDVEVARELSDLEMTERLSAATLLRWETDFSGPEARQALMILADMSAFLNLPAAETPANPAPDFATQRQMMAQTVAYVSRTVRQLPNFFATRAATSFEDAPPGYEGRQYVTAQPLRLVARSQATVLYREGGEVVDTGETQPKKSRGVVNGLTTWGEFGPILTTVLVDAAHSSLA